MHSGEVHEKSVYSSSGIPKKVYLGLWYTQKIGMNHIHIHDLGRLLPITVIGAKTKTLFVDVYYRKSSQVIRTLQDMKVNFKPWSSVQVYDYDLDKKILVFYFADKSDAAIFKLVWDSTNLDK